MNVLQWLHAQVVTLASVIGGVIGNKPEPAREVAIYTLVLIVLAFIVPKIIKLVTK